MSKINIEFDGKIYSVDETTLTPLASPIIQALVGQLAGTGAVIKLGGSNYEVDSSKLASVRNVLTDHFSAVAGTDSKVTVNGVEYGLSKTKLQSATDKMHETLAKFKSEVFSEGLAYELNEDGISYSVIGIGTCTDTDIVIPATHEGLPVTELKSHTEWYESKGSMYEETVGAFQGCENITSVIIPDSLLKIGDLTFAKCDNLMSITIGKSVMSIGAEAFTNQWAVGDIGLWRLAEVINKSSLDITKGSEDYSGVAFYALDVHNGESNLINVDGYIFYACEGANYLVNYIGTDAELILPEKCNGENYKINGNAFRNNFTITSVAIPTSVTDFGEGAFYNCDYLTKICITDIAYWCSMNFKSSNANPIDMDVWSSTKRLYLNGELVTNLEIPEGVTRIGDYTFIYDSDLTSVTIPSSVTSIGVSAFYWCDGIKNITFNGTTAQWNNITKGDKWAFQIKAPVQCTDGQVTL